MGQASWGLGRGARRRMPGASEMRGRTEPSVPAVLTPDSSVPLECHVLDVLVFLGSRESGPAGKTPGLVFLTLM